MNKPSSAPLLPKIVIVLITIAALIGIAQSQENKSHALNIGVVLVQDEEHFNEDQITNFLTGIHGAEAILRAQKNATFLPVMDPTILNRFGEAKKLIQSEPEPSHSWQWKNVQSIVQQIGTSIPLVVKPAEWSTMTFALAYDDANHQIVIDGQYVATETVDGLAALLSHEVTHAVFMQRAMEMTGMTRMEIREASILCDDFSLNWRVTTETLAFRNQAAWHAAHPKMTSTEGNQFKSVIEQAIRAEGSDKRDFALTMINYGRNEKADHDLRNGHTQGMMCGHTPIITKERRRQAFLFPDLDPVYLRPLIAASR